MTVLRSLGLPIAVGRLLLGPATNPRRSRVSWESRERRAPLRDPRRHRPDACAEPHWCIDRRAGWAIRCLALGRRRLSLATHRLSWRAGASTDVRERRPAGRLHEPRHGALRHDELASTSEAWTRPRHLSFARRRRHLGYGVLRLWRSQRRPSA